MLVNALSQMEARHLPDGKHAAALGLEADMQSTIKARALPGKPRHTVERIPSVPCRDAPAVYPMLSGKSFVSCHALRVLMLTGARTSEIRFARRDDVADDVLVIPPGRTKTGSEHRGPPSAEARDVINETRRLHDSDLLFPRRGASRCRTRP